MTIEMIALYGLAFIGLCWIANHLVRLVLSMLP